MDRGDPRPGRHGRVYKAYDPRLKRYVALKLLAPGLADDTGFRERFLRESELAASLDHPSIVPIYDAGEVGGQLYIAMRYVEGTDLKALIREDGALAPAHAFALLAQLADALDTAHERGLVHRDVKPSNALLDSAGHLYLADFGLTQSTSDRSELTAAGQIVGTVDYVAPEQIEGEEIDGRADLYSLGCLLYECLTGEVPFPRDTELAVLWAHLHEPPPRPSERNPALLGRSTPCLRRRWRSRPDERHASCAELVEEAREALGLREIVLVRDRRPLLMVSAGLLLAVSAAIAAFLVSQGGGRPAKPSTKPTLALKADALQRIDPKTNKLVATLRLGSDPTGVAVGEGAVWAIHRDDNRISKIDPRTNAVVATAPPRGPQSAAVGAGLALGGQRRGRTVTQLDLAHGSRHPRCVGPGVGGPVELAAFGSGAVWVASRCHRARGADQPAELHRQRDGLRRRAEGALKEIAVGEGAVWISTTPSSPTSTRVFRVDPPTERGCADPAPPRRGGIACRRGRRLGRKRLGKHGVADRAVPRTASCARSLSGTTRPPSRWAREVSGRRTTRTGPSRASTPNRAGSSRQSGSARIPTTLPWVQAASG